MVQEHDAREDVRHKTANAIAKIEQIMALRKKLPSRGGSDDHHDNDLKSVARSLGDAMAHKVGAPDYDPLAMLLTELHHYDDDARFSPKQQAEARVAIECMAMAFGVQHQFNARVAAESYAKAHPDESGPSTSYPGHR